MQKLFSYGDAPVDEVDLAWRVRDTVASLRGAVPGIEELGRVSSEHGLDFATMVFYKAVLASPEHGEFVRRIEGTRVEPRGSTARPRLLIVPAMFYRERPDLGGDGSLVAAVARACGYQVEVFPTLSRGSISDNAAIIAETMTKDTGDPVWLLSLSKGGGEIRVALQRDGAGWIDRVRGWINVSGIVQGSHFVDYMLSTRSGRLRARGFCLALGTSFSAVTELRTTHGFWEKPFVPAPHMTVINLVGVPLGCHVQKALVGRYRRLGVLGPNDGFVLLPTALIHPGPIYPIWGSDHLFRSPQVSPLLYRLFNLLRERETRDMLRASEPVVALHGHREVGT
jgi:hypothetical protein